MGGGDGLRITNYESGIKDKTVIKRCDVKSRYTAAALAIAGVNLSQSPYYGETVNLKKLLVYVKCTVYFTCK